jgi:hypothetical protein
LFIPTFGLGQLTPIETESRFGVRLNLATRAGRKREKPVVRFNFILPVIAAAAAASTLTACAHSPPPVWTYYDQCAADNPSFLAMAECGKQKRLTECTPSNTCTPEGTTFMEYVDSLALSVKNKKMTEAEAMRHYTEYKSGGT